MKAMRVFIVLLAVIFIGYSFFKQITEKNIFTMEMENGRGTELVLDDKNDAAEGENNESIYGKWVLNRVVLESKNYSGESEEAYLGYEVEYDSKYFRLGDETFQNPRYMQYDFKVSDYNINGDFKSPDLYELLSDEKISVDMVEEYEDIGEIPLTYYVLEFDDNPFIPVGLQCVLLNKDTMLVGMWGKIILAHRVNLGQSEVSIQENIQHAIEAVEEKVSELDMYSRYISEKSEGEAFLVVECDGIAKKFNDVVKNIEFQNKYYAVYVGEQWEDHKVNWDWFFVSENFDEVLWYFVADSEVYTLIEWRESEHYRSELIEMKVETRRRESCQKEKLAMGVAYKLDRAYMMDLILKYRGMHRHTLIEEPIAGRLETIAPQFKSRLSFRESAKDLQIPARFVLYKGLDLTVGDRYDVTGAGLCKSNILLLNETREIVGILNLIKKENQFYLAGRHELLMEGINTGIHKNYSLGFLDEMNSKILYDFYYEQDRIRKTGIPCLLKSITEFLMEEVQPAPTPLVIDFGTSNTSVGAYLDENYIAARTREELKRGGVKMNDINKIAFENNLNREEEMEEIIPTVISIQDCSNPNAIRCRFGYDALRNARKHSYNNSASIFYGIKKMGEQL